MVVGGAQYEGPVTSHKTWFDVLAECSFGLMGGPGAEAEQPPTSTVVRIGNVVTPEELTDDVAQKEVGECVDGCSEKVSRIYRKLYFFSHPSVGPMMININNYDKRNKARVCCNSFGAVLGLFIC